LKQFIQPSFELNPDSADKCF